MIQLLFAVLAFIVVGYKLYSEVIKDYTGWTNKQPVRRSGSDFEVDRYLQPIKYYRDLSASDKIKFLERVQYICNSKTFRGMEGLIITDEIRSIVAASAVQIGFRLDKWKFPSYHSFRVYPESFYSGIFRKFLKGGAGYQGQIWFSLADYRKGYADPENGINLGLHEMAHALIIEMENGNMGFEFSSAYEQVEKLAHDRIPKIKNGVIKFLRDYAATNTMEFIAVCTEHFFERADEFRREDPELYGAFMWLYKQEPHTPPSILQITNLPQQEKVKRNYRYAKWHWSLTLALLGIFLAPVILIFLLQNVRLENEIIFWICTGIVLLAAFLLYRPVVKTSALNTTQFVLCHLVGMGPFALSIIFTLNNLIPVWNEGEPHTVKSVYRINEHEAIAEFKDPAFKDDYNSRKFDTDQSGTVKSGDILVVVTEYGLFGIPVRGENIVVHGAQNSY